MMTGKNYIGNLRSGKGNKTYKTFNPELNVDNRINFYEATPEEIDQALDLATSAYQEYKATSGTQKALFLRTIAEEILVLGDLLLQTYCQETGFPTNRAINERTRTLFQLQSFANLVHEGSWVEASIDTPKSDREPMPKPDLRKMLFPLGPVVVFGASNFPLAYATAGGDTASALAAGCPVIVKSHPMHSGTGELIASAIVRAAEKTGMPNGVFSNLNSKDTEVGTYLVRHPQTKAVGFTGSIKGGRALYDLAAKREEPIPVFAEMGSINPVILLPQALHNKARMMAKNYASSITLSAGQFCTNPGLLLGVEGEQLNIFIESLSKEISSMAPSCFVHPQIHDAFEANKKQMLSQKGIGVALNKTTEVQKNYALPAVTTVSGEVFLENPILHQEVFGPYSLVVLCKDVNQMELIISKLEGQLTGSIMADKNELFQYSKLVSALQNRVGRIIFNGVPTGVEVCSSMVHGGPYPASTDSRFTAVGVNAIKRWVRPFTYQNCPDQFLPDALKNKNPLGIKRLINDVWTTEML